MNGTIELIKATEIAIQKAEPQETEGNLIRQGVRNIIQRHKHHIIHLNRMKWIKPTIQRLQDKKNFVILSADKENSTVILNKIEYEKKVMNLLETCDHVEVKQEPTTEIKKLCNL
ncbi:unnamed protein product [Orchesella dallaii]|uniref:Uncharacterized protein n=1 Tax=Orchesella dallaii TaxID=48710 RepID=A0ABP1Q8I1_9HEXA